MKEFDVVGIGALNLRTRMLRATHAGTNLDPNPGPSKRSPMSEEERKEKARAYARDLRARQKASA